MRGRIAVVVACVAATASLMVVSTPAQAATQNLCGSVSVVKWTRSTNVVIKPGCTIFSRKTDFGAYKLVFQRDGNLVEYTGKYGATWSSGTYGRGAAKLILQTDGNMVIYTGSNRALWAEPGIDRATYYRLFIDTASFPTIVKQNSNDNRAWRDSWANRA